MDRASGAGADGARGIQFRNERPRPAPCQASRSQRNARRPVAGPWRRHYRSRPAKLYSRRRAVHRIVVARQRLRAPVQPDGRRRDCRDLPRAAMAVDSPWGTNQRWPARDRGALRSPPDGRAGQDSSRSGLGAACRRSIPHCRAPVRCDDQTGYVRRIPDTARLRAPELMENETMTLRSQLPTAEELRSLWRDSPRWRGIERPYSAEDVVRLRGTLAVEHSIARLTSEKLWRYVNEKPFVNSLGALTGNQAMQQVKAGLDAIYLS